MASPLLSFLLTIALAVSAASAARGAAATDADFIRTSCRATKYPALCEKGLSSYAPTVKRNPVELAKAALAVSADRARSASSYVAQLFGGNGQNSAGRGGGAVKDCLDNLGDGVDRLRSSFSELGRAGRSGTAQFRWHMSNVETWVSAALTDENTCLDSLKARQLDPNLRAAARGKVVQVAQVTSNALALVSRCAGTGY